MSGLEIPWFLQPTLSRTPAQAAAAETRDRRVVAAALLLPAVFTANLEPSRPNSSFPT